MEDNIGEGGVETNKGGGVRGSGEATVTKEGRVRVGEDGATGKAESHWSFLPELELLQR